MQRVYNILFMYSELLIEINNTIMLKLKLANCDEIRFSVDDY